MAQVAVLSKVDDPPGTDIVTVVSANPGIVLLDREKFDAFYEGMKRETDTLVPDTSTAKGREAIRRMATRVRDTKAAIDRARLGLTKQWREQTDLANAAGKEIKSRLEALEDQVRKPLTDWEAAEEARIAECDAIIAGFRESARERLDDTSDAARQRGKDVWHTVINPVRFGSLTDTAETAKADAVAALKVTVARLVKEEEDRAELAKLRAEAEARAAREEAEQAERDRINTQRDREVAESVAKHENELRIEREAREKAERDAAAKEELRIAEQRRAEREKQQAEEARERAAEQQRKDEANKALQRRLATEAKEAIVLCGASDNVAQNVVRAIRAGVIPHVKWEARS